MRRWAFAALILVCAAVCYYFMQPGIMTYDSRNQWQQALNQSYCDAHPPLMAWWWGLLSRVTQLGHESLLIFHLGVFWCAIYVLGRMLAHGRAGRWWMGVPVLLLPIPTVVGMLGVMWKDTGLTVTWLLAVVLMMDTYWRGITLSRGRAVAIILLIFYGLGVRYNAATTLPAMCFALAWLALPAKRRKVLWLGATTVAMCACFLVSVLAFNRAIEARRCHFEQFALLHEIAAVSRMLQTPLYPQYVLDQSGQDGETFTHLHNALRTYRFEEDAPTWTDDPQHIAELHAAYLSLITDHTATYFEHRTTVFLNVLGFSPWVVYPYFVAQTVDVPNLKKSDDHRIKLILYLYDFRRALTNRGYFWLGLCLVLSGLCCTRVLPKRERICVALLCASALMNVLPLYFLAHSPDFRYLYWTMMGTIIATVMTARGLWHRKHHV